MERVLNVRDFKNRLTLFRTFTCAFGRFPAPGPPVGLAVPDGRPALPPEPLDAAVLHAGGRGAVQHAAHGLLGVAAVGLVWKRKMALLRNVVRRAEKKW